MVLLLLGVSCTDSEQGAAPQTSTPSLSAVVIEVAEEGLHGISLDSLREAGLNVDELTMEDLQLSSAGESVPYLISDQTLVFYGLSSTDRYAPTAPYILRQGSPGQPMAEKTLAMGSQVPVTTIQRTLRLESNSVYLAESHSEENQDVWFWHTIGQGQKLELNAALPHLSQEPAQLTIRLYGQTHNPQVEPDHDFDLYANGRKLQTIAWDGQRGHTSKVELPAAVLVPGDNALVFDNEIPGSSFLDVMVLDWLEIVYSALPIAEDEQIRFTMPAGVLSLGGFNSRPLLFDLSERTAPRVLHGWDYKDGRINLATAEPLQIAAIGPSGMLKPKAIRPLYESEWRSPTRQADLIIITTDELAPALDPLVAARQSQGLQVAVVPLKEVYDSFGHGLASPESMTAFISYAYHNWQKPGPRYLLLVGDATTDYHNYLGHDLPALVPSPMVPVEYSGETVSDARLADVDNDLRPDLAVGRWPASNIAQVRSLVERTLAYERGSASQRALFLADGTESQFANLARSLSTEADFAPENTVLLDGPSALEVVEQWHTGAWLATYIGHGSVERWGKEDVFSNEAIADLQSSSNPPIVLQLTCLTGLFAHPDLTSLSETMLLHREGPVLLIAATSLTLSTDQEALARPLLNYLRDPHFIRIGDAFQAAKQTLDVAQSNGLREISDTYVLLGDPSAAIIRPLP